MVEREFIVVYYVLICCTHDGVITIIKKPSYFIIHDQMSFSVVRKKMRSRNSYVVSLIAVFIAVVCSTDSLSIDQLINSISIKRIFEDKRFN